MSEDKNNHHHQNNGIKSIPSPSEPIEDYYEITNELLGRGYFAEVYVGIDKRTKQRVAVKVVDKNKVEKEESLEREVYILSSINHMYIVKMESIFDTVDNLFIVMELMEGGELFEEIVRRKTFTEKDASYIMRQVFEAIGYLHSQRIIHRDVKLENLLLVKKNALDIKVTDFGLSTIFNEVTIFTACGTPFYVAPEIVMGEGYSFEVDLWAAGVLLYILLSGKLPYASNNEVDLYKQIIDNVLVFKSPQFDSISDTAKDLISKLIVTKPEERLTPKQALNHPFITGDYSESLSLRPLPCSFIDNLREYSNTSKISKSTFLTT